jgi:hypothetical protein
VNLIRKPTLPRGLVLFLFAASMAYVESAVVFYLRTMINRVEPYQPDPLPNFAGLAGAEIVREAATLMMLAAAGWLTGRTLRARFGYFLIAFGVWDIFYYVFLKALTGWPRSLLDWDILFLIPLPWWGPVLAPACIATLMILYGLLLSQFERISGRGCLEWKTWLPMLAGAGVVLALFTFMSDALRVAGQGEAALRKMLPKDFQWGLFTLALVLMATPLLGAFWRGRGSARPVLQAAGGSVEQG